MAITDKLNTAWTTNEAMDAVFEARAVFQNLNSVAVEAKSRIDEIAASASFAGVDDELKVELAACRTIANALVNALAGHSDLISWSQPVDGE